MPLRSLRAAVSATASIAAVAGVLALMANDVAAENETEAAILSRRAVRGFLPTPVDRTAVEHLLDAPQRAARAQGQPRWRWVCESCDDGDCEQRHWLPQG